MRRRSTLAIGILLLAILTGCATAARNGASSPVAAGESAAISEQTDTAAQEQAQAWLDAATLPPGAIQSPYATGAFHSYQGWPCRPVAQLEGFWTVPAMTVAETANWLMANPTANLVTTAVGPVTEDPSIDETIVGFIPADDSQQGVVYTVAKTDDGVAVRAEIAALAADASYPEPPGGGTWGKPGQG